jgi:NAD(P)-dependent dehydrogenase (short-subunit alcohol dehydrogenase family)
MARLTNTTVIVTGGARGIGAALAVLAADEGAALVIGDVLDEGGRTDDAAGPRVIVTRMCAASPTGQGS